MNDKLPKEENGAPLATQDPIEELPIEERVERAIIKGDLRHLKGAEALMMYKRVCESVGLNYWTKPFGFIKMRDGSVQLYANKNCTDQLRSKNKVSIEIIDRGVTEDTLTVHVRATDSKGRKDEDFGSVPFSAHLKGEDRSNAIMRAVTKAKRRVTLSLCGLGWPDDTEIESIDGARRLPMSEVMGRDGEAALDIKP